MIESILLMWTFIKITKQTLIRANVNCVAAADLQHEVGQIIRSILCDFDICSFDFTFPSTYTIFISQQKIKINQIE